MNKRYTEKRYLKNFKKGEQTIVLNCDDYTYIHECDEKVFGPIVQHSYYLVGEGVNRLYELEDKETPKKPIRANCMYWCPECDANISFDNNYCHGCGQKIDWSDYE